LRKRNEETRGTYLLLFHLIYVDESTFIFETLDDMTHGGQVILDHFFQFGLIMHIGRRGIKSKTEALHIPKKLGEKPIPAGMIVHLENEAYFHFTEKIKYLGSIVTYCLRDNIDITARISKAHGTMGALKELFDSPEVSLDVKLRLYIAIPLATPIWGCKSWALRDTDRNELKVFHHRVIHRIMGISMKRVREERISNKEIRSRFFKIPTINNFITRRTHSKNNF
jgi:hypothetical protein